MNTQLILLDEGRVWLEPHLDRLEAMAEAHREGHLHQMATCTDREETFAWCVWHTLRGRTRSVHV
jgi:hypothetical protein